MTRSILLTVVVAAVLLPGPAAAATCGTLAALSLPNAHITSATPVAAGAFVAPAVPRPAGTAPAAVAAAARANAPSPYANLPAFCRVTATLTPSSDSDIRIEVWLPDRAMWNGKFQAVGNGGWAGTLVYTALAAAVARGYAAANTDTGHVGGTASFAIGHPEKVIDMAYRAVHEMTVQAKTIVKAYYANAPTLSLWNGCSLGGRQGITEALRYPADFDAIVAGAPAVNWMNLHVGRMALNASANRTPDSVVPPSKYPLIHEAALAACDRLDGVKDGVIDNPMSCHFDPKVLECKGGQDPASCLTAPQVASVKALYAPVKNPATGETLIPGLEPGSELSFSTIGGANPLGTVLEAQKYVIHKDPYWNFHSSTIAGDLEAAHRADPDDALSSSSTNLKPFFDRGGKLLIYHGFQDPQLPPENTVAYYTKVIGGSGRDLAGRQIALYMVPGMNHCAGGPGTDAFDKIAAIESWVATGKAPESIAAAPRTTGVVDRTRPLCQYPKVARWRGTGSTDDAANFSCVADTAARSSR
jgi:feruloyl esterase